MNAIKCPNCSSESYEQFSKSQFRCLQCKSVFDDLNYTSEPQEFQLDLSSNLLDASIDEYTIAPIPKRVINYIIDFIAISSINLLLATTGLYDGENILYIIALMFLYYILMEGLFGQTIGKFITKTKVVDLDGNKISFGRAILRTLCRFIPFEYISGFFSNGIFWHDSLAKTKVISIQ